MFSKTIVPATIALCLATVASGADLNVHPIKARDANTLERRHTGAYTHCGLQVQYDKIKPQFAVDWFIKWQGPQAGYYLYADGPVNTATYQLPTGAAANPSMTLIGNDFKMVLQVKVQPDGNIIGVALDDAEVDSARYVNPTFGMQCSDDPDQANLVTIPVGDIARTLGMRLTADYAGLLP
ncbi:uncharacterized protein L969DRAFT_88419 [Mixia osmundae IAM 14324]|uniref:uncharacterized protein n=1 Tax=Mixia osmundae (strain CBS 9802 / IAM 14324 / JCM 22182 / KY 12970) TaxID=764103 RepID=UPI0004A54B3F|nr:uncharacterized protein L969DRAFT_88419 [Mixia osmundae IAM 14324]KEI39023.1 hypothetical protein L969DRAFT_88419 [Mixia osmundae IAM 14324]